MLCSYIEEDFEDWTNSNPDIIKKEKEVVIEEIVKDNDNDVIVWKRLFLVIREESLFVTSAYYFILCFPYYVGSISSFISYLNSLFISFLFYFII